MQNHDGRNQLQIFHTEPDELTVSIVTDDDDVLSVSLFPDEIANLILNLSYKLASIKGYTPDMFTPSFKHGQSRSWMKTF